MALPSQSTRSMHQRGHMYRRRRSWRTRALVGVVVVATVGFGVYRIWFSGPGGKSEAQGVDILSGDPAAALVDMPAGGNTPASSRQGADSRPSQSQASISKPKTETPATGTPPKSPALTDIAMGQPSPGPVIPIGASNPPASRIAEPPGHSRSGAATGDGSAGVAAPAPKAPSPPPVDTPRKADAPDSSHAPGTTDPAASSPQMSPERTRAMQDLAAGTTLLNANKAVEGRLRLSEALLSGALTAVDADRTRQTLMTLNEQLVFGRQTEPDDPFASVYVVQENDRLERIAKEENLATDWRLIMRVNGLARPESIRVGQRLKLVHGPFHAVVHKQSFRLDLLLGESSRQVFVTSFPVGLGADRQATPSGNFKVRRNSKLIDPAWTNPRTGQRFSADDPANPIGDRWIGLQGADPATADLAGYGIHGTIDPDSIGQQRSMGCIRMLADDVALVFEVLVEERSTVRVVED